jgi:hypothetical protein
MAEHPRTAAPDYISSDCPLGGHHIAQGFEQRPGAPPLQHPLSPGAHGLWLELMQMRMKTTGKSPRQPDDAGGLQQVAQGLHKPSSSPTASCAACSLGEHVNAAVRERAHDALPDPGDAAHREDLRGRGHRAEIDTYAPLVPDGSNWKATLLIEYPDENERKRELARLIGVEDRMFVEVEGHARVYAIADEDLDRENDEKTSAVHFVRFEFTPAMRSAVKAGAGVKLGCDHTCYPAHTTIAAETLASLASDY